MISISLNFTQMTVPAMLQFFATRELRDSWVNNDNNSGRVALTLLDVVCRFGRALLTAQMIQDTTDKQISWLFI